MKSRCYEALPLDEGGLVRAMDRLRAVLRKRSLKNSEVRNRIASAALTRKDLFTTDDLLRGLVGRRVSPATVYRVLPLLVDAGLLREVESGDYERDRSARDDSARLVCVLCGAVVDLGVVASLPTERRFAERFAFEVTGRSHELRGYCKACRAGPGRPGLVRGDRAMYTRAP